MSALLDAVDALTKPSRTVVAQDGGNIAMVTLPSLLEQLDAAIRSSIGGNTSGGSDPATRSILDIGSLQRFMTITSMLGDWARMVKAPIDRQSAAATLAAWYPMYMQRNPEQSSIDFYVKQLAGWANQITAALDPPREKDLPDACPACGAAEWWDARTGEKHTRPLIIRYRPGAALVEDARGTCRACEKVWHARELAYELEVAATA